MKFPTIGEYNQTLQKQGGAAFQTLKSLSFVAAKSVPIKIFIYGSGSYAAVFKANQNGKYFAIRCFLTAHQDTINRYKAISDYLNAIDASWKVENQLIDREIQVNGNLFPVLKMEWIDGILINEFISANIDKESVLSAIQKKLVELSESLEQNRVGHGDLQCGNIIVQGSSIDFKLKLIDYDGMFVPSLSSTKNTENGRSEFQHPNRSYDSFNHEIDRFSFWVMLTALEALKYEPSLWKEVMQGGFNTLDNLLFTGIDFSNTEVSPLFNRLEQINSLSLNYYVEKLKKFCNLISMQIEKPILYNQNGVVFKPQNTTNSSLDNSKKVNQAVVEADGKVVIVANIENANVLTMKLQKLGTAPLHLDKQIYVGRTLLITNGNEIKRITISQNDNIIKVNF